MLVCARDEDEQDLEDLPFTYKSEPEDVEMADAVSV